MSIITFPTVQFWIKRDWTPPANNRVNQSEWTKGRKVVRLPGAALWRVSAMHRPITNERDTWPWKAFFAAVEGEAHHFYMPYACNQVAAGSRTIGSGGAAQGAVTAPIAGMTANATPFLYAGQALTITLPSGARQLVILTANLNSSSGGTGIATFRAGLRETVSAGATVEARNPYCEMAMASPNPGWTEQSGIFQIAFDAVEAFGD